MKIEITTYEYVKDSGNDVTTENFRYGTNTEGYLCFEFDTPQIKYLGMDGHATSLDMLTIHFDVNGYNQDTGNLGRTHTINVQFIAETRLDENLLIKGDSHKYDSVEPVMVGYKYHHKILLLPTSNLDIVEELSQVHPEQIDHKMYED